MGRRVESSAPTAADLDAETARRRARQLELRLRMCAPEGSDLRATIVKSAEAAKELLPQERLAALLDLADDVRPMLPAAVVKYTLSPAFNEWRA